jgi:FMN reductase
MGAGVADQIADGTWSAYQHQFAGNASRAARSVGDIDFNSPLTRLAAGATAPRSGEQAVGLPAPAREQDFQ